MDVVLNSTRSSRLDWGKYKGQWLYDGYFFNSNDDAFVFGIFVDIENNPYSVKILGRTTGKRYKEYKVDGWLQAFACCEDFMKSVYPGGNDGVTKNSGLYP